MNIIEIQVDRTIRLIRAVRIPLLQLGGTSKEAPVIKNFLRECDYENGYRKALCDVKDWIGNHSVTMRYLRMFNEKNLTMLLDAFLKGSDMMIVHGDETEFSFTTDGRKVTGIKATRRNNETD